MCDPLQGEGSRTLSTDSALTLGLVAACAGAPKQQDMAAGETCAGGCHWQVRTCWWTTAGHLTWRAVRRPSDPSCVKRPGKGGGQQAAHLPTQARESIDGKHPSPPRRWDPAQSAHPFRRAGRDQAQSSDDGRTVDASDHSFISTQGEGRNVAAHHRKLGTQESLTHKKAPAVSRCRVRSRDPFVSGARTPILPSQRHLRIVAPCTESAAGVWTSAEAIWHGLASPLTATGCDAPSLHEGRRRRAALPSPTSLCYGATGIPLAGALGGYAHAQPRVAAVVTQ